MLPFLLTKSTSIPSRFSVLIGHIIGVALRLKPLGKRKEGEGGQITGRAMVEANQVGGIPISLASVDVWQDSITSFYCNHILSAKTALPMYASVSKTLLPQSR